MNITCMVHEEPITRGHCVGCLQDHNSHLDASMSRDKNPTQRSSAKGGAKP